MPEKFMPSLKIRILTEQDKCFGPGIAVLLRRVQTHQSLRAAAKSMDMAYSKAWTMVRRCEAQLGFALLHNTVGGAHGGGAVLTQQAMRLLEEYEAYCQEINTYAEKLFQKQFASLLQGGDVPKQP